MAIKTKKSTPETGMCLIAEEKIPSLFGAPGRTRTFDQRIMSPLL